MATGALVAMAILANEPRPVDVRRVDASPVEQGVLSATYTTTIQAARPTTFTEEFTPVAPRQAPPPAAMTDPPLSSSVPETTTSSLPPSRDDNCDLAYVTDGVCVPWRFPRGVWRLCDWLHDQGLTHIEVQGWDRHHLDLDQDGIACEHPDWPRPER